MRKTSLVVMALALAAPGAAHAADKHFQFKVPVTFDLVPRQDVSASEVHCAVYSDDSMGEGALIGQGRTTNGPSGFINANKSKSSNDYYVNFDAAAGKDPALASHYQCWLVLKNGGDSCRPDEAGDKPQWCTSNSDGDTLLVSGAF